MEDEITSALEVEAAVRHHVIFVGLTSGPTDKAKHAVWECVVAAESEAGQRRQDMWLTED